MTLDVRDREGIAKLREALRTGGYEPARMRPMLRADDENITPRPTDIPVVTRLLPEGDALATLLRLFLLGLAVPLADARAALAPLSIEHALRLGVIRRTADGIESTVRILPAGDLVIACDRTPEASADLAADHVMGVATSSILLASLTVRRPIARALDVGAGSGIQTVLAAGHAERVIACDINPRALNFTAFNALLNGRDNVECRAGSFFEPVAGERFDLIVSNPPFVISPENGLIFRDSGLRGDDVSRMVVRQAAEQLEEGGLAFVLISWGVRKGQAWPDPLRPWVADLPCDIWILHHSTEAPLLYAASWNSALNTRAAEFSSALDRWTAYLADAGFAAVSYGAAILRRRNASTNWVRFDDIHGQREPGSGEQIEQLLAAQDYIVSLSDPRQLLDARLTLAPAHRLDQVLRARDGTFAVEAASLRLERGLRFQSTVDAFSAHLLARLDGKRTLREAIAATAEQFSADGIGAAESEKEALPTMVRMLALGYVTLATDPR